MADDPSLAELTRALTQLAAALVAAVEDQRQLREVLQRMLISQRRLSILQTVLILFAFLLLFFLAYQVRAAHVETANLTKVIVDQTQAVVAQLQALLDRVPLP